MTLSRNFFLVGTIFLLIGICLGSYMGISQDHTLQPVHAHLNLLGFTLMMVFGLVYRVVPAMAASSLARAHFWLHSLGAAFLLVMLGGYLLGYIPESAMPAAGLGEVSVLVGVVLFFVNTWRNAGERAARSEYAAI